MKAENLKRGLKVRSRYGRTIRTIEAIGPDFVVLGYRNTRNLPVSYRLKKDAFLRYWEVA